MTGTTSGSNLIIRIVLALAALAVTGWLIYYYKPAPAGPDPDLIANVGPREIRAEGFRREAVRRGGIRREGLDRQALLEEMISYEVQLAKALDDGLDKDPEVVRAYHNLLVGKLRQGLLQPRIESVTITDEMVAAHYEANPEKYTRPARARVALLFLETHPAMSEEKRQSVRDRMAEAREKALAVPPEERGFGALAISCSEDQASRYKGGDIGWLAEGRAYRWPDPVVSAAFALPEPGAVSDVIETDKGLYLVKLLDRRPAEITPLEKVAARIRHKMLLEKRKETEAAFLAETRSATPIEVFAEALEAVELPDAGDSGQRPPSLP